MWIWCPGGVLLYFIRHVVHEEWSQTKLGRNVQLLHMMTFPSNILCKCLPPAPQKGKRRKEKVKEEEGNSTEVGRDRKARLRRREEGRGERHWPFRETQSCRVSSKLCLLHTQKPLLILPHSYLLVLLCPLFSQQMVSPLCSVYVTPTVLHKFSIKFVL